MKSIGVSVDVVSLWWGNNAYKLENNNKFHRNPLVATLEYEPTEDAEYRLLKVFEFLLGDEEISIDTLTMDKTVDR